MSVLKLDLVCSARIAGFDFRIFHQRRRIADFGGLTFSWSAL
jgi:hypothetical protein